MSRTTRFLAALVASCCAALAFASFASAQQVLYGADGARGNPSNLYILDPSSGAVLQAGGPIGFAVTGLAVDPSTGTLYGVTGGEDDNAPAHLITINKATGAGTDVGDLQGGTDTPVADITFTPDATLFGWSEDSDDLVTIDKATGAATVVGDSGIGTSGSGLASNAAGVLFFAGDSGDDGDLRTVDRNTGLTTVVATMNGPGNQVPALAFDSGGTLFGVGLDTGPNTPTAVLETIDTGSGAVSVRGPSVNRLAAIKFAPKPGRTVNLQKKKLKKGKKVRLSGHVDSPDSLRTLLLSGAPGPRGACEVGQTVELQRKKPKGGSFAAFRQLTTDNAGNFSTDAKVKKTFKYRAVLSETALCGNATSNVQNVKAKKKKKK